MSTRHDVARHAAAYPTSKMNVTGVREKVIIEKEDNFTQPGDRYRSWDAARQERFRQRFLQMLLHPRTTKEIRRYDAHPHALSYTIPSPLRIRIWLSYWSKCDADLGSKLTEALRMESAALL